ncbi:MAG: RNA polymerase sigma factor [Bacteroidia bacterium]|nr:RNA polymerase sigma factor [Bacteroidia bacterium]
MVNEKQLIEGCLKQDRKAQKILYEKYSSVFLGVCSRYTRDRSEAEDVLQEAFLKIFTNIKQYAGIGSFEGWMRRIVVNTAISQFRQNVKHYYQQDITDVKESKIDENVVIDADFTQEELLQVIRDLPRGYQMVFNLYAVEGYMHKEIAEMLKIDVNTSKSQFSRARKIIQMKLNELSKERMPGIILKENESRI